jgi:hypothetical protein
MIYKGPQLSTYWGDNQYSDRMAHVMKNEQGYYIEMYKGEDLIETRPLYDHSEYYAEDAAENYVMGILNP